MKTKTKISLKSIVYLIVIIIVAALTGLLLYHYLSDTTEASLVPPTPEPSATPVVRIVTQTEEKLVEVEKEITAEMVQDGLRQIGLLSTEEYYFTIVTNYSSVKSLFNHDIGITESSYVASYDGVVTAGVDFSEITALKDDESRTVTVVLPGARIQHIDIDPESFRLYSEKSGLWNPISVADFNDSLVELERGAEEMAAERGILERAAENAENVIRNFISGLIDTSVYTIRFETET